MTGTPLGQTTFLPHLLELHNPRVMAREFLPDAYLFKLFYRNSKRFNWTHEGLGFKIMMKLSHAFSVKATHRGGPLPTGHDSKRAFTRWLPKTYVGNVPIYVDDYISLQKDKNRIASFVGNFTDQVKDSIEGARKYFDNVLFSGRSGSLAQLYAASPVTEVSTGIYTVQLADSTSFKALQMGQRVEIVTISGTTFTLKENSSPKISNNLLVTRQYKSSGNYYVRLESQVSGITITPANYDGDCYIVGESVATDYNWYGVHDICNDTLTLPGQNQIDSDHPEVGIDPTAYFQVQPLLRNMENAAFTTATVLDQTKQILVDDHGADFNKILIITTQFTADRYGAECRTNRDFPGTMTVEDLGLKGTTYDGRPIVVLRNCPAGNLYMLTPEHIGLCLQAGMNFEWIQKLAGIDLQLDRNTTTFNLDWILKGQLCTDDRHTQARVYGIKTTL